MRHLSLLFAVALALSLGAAPRPALADDDRAKAKVHYDRALAYEKLEDWQRAAEQYLAAYERLPDAEFFFLAAEVYVKADDVRRAHEHYSKYLEQEPNGRVAAQARAALARLAPRLAELEAADKRAAEPTAPAEPTPDSAERTPVAASEDGPAPAGGAQAEPAPTSASADPAVAQAGLAARDDSAASGGTGLRIAGLVSAGVGVVALGLGIKYGLDAKDLSDELSSVDAWSAERARQYEDGESAESKMFIFTGVGAAALVTGGVLYYLGHRAQAAEQRDVAFAPSVGAESAGFVLSGRF